MDNHTILVVDDSLTMRMMNQMLLTRASYEVLVAASGEEALEIVADQTPDLVLLDVVMPGLSGFETCAAMRALPSMAQTPILMLTTRSEPENVEKGYAAGASDYLTKPIDNDEIFTKLREHLAAAKQAAS